MTQQTGKPPAALQKLQLPQRKYAGNGLQKSETHAPHRPINTRYTVERRSALPMPINKRQDNGKAETIPDARKNTPSFPGETGNHPTRSSIIILPVTAAMPLLPGKTQPAPTQEASRPQRTQPHHHLIPTCTRRYPLASRLSTIWNGQRKPAQNQI